MKKHIKYPKIDQCRSIIKTVIQGATFIGLDTSGKPTYNPNAPKPIITFKGTVKLHGTNAGVSYNTTDGFWIQSRQNIITMEHDNAGFAFFVESHKNIFQTMLNAIIFKENIDPSIYTTTIYGEWAGKGIQKGVGISQVEKSFFIFGVKVSNLNDEEFVSYWIDSSKLHCPSYRIYNVEDFETYSVDVDFNNPQLAQNKVIEITEKVEKECPVARALGIENGVGEGVVWSAYYEGSNLRFKVKGEKHSVTRVKTLAKVDTEKITSIQAFVEYAVTENRLQQAIQEVFGEGDLSITKMGDVIRWVIKDIVEEEMDTLVENNLIPKDINKYISFKVREMMLVELERV